MFVMTAEIISVGTELLLGDTIDTHAATLGKALAANGVGHQRRQTVGDSLDRLTEAVKLALSRADTVFLIGGLGPTDDDLTREGIAAGLGVELVEDAGARTALEEMMKARGVTDVKSLLKQALKPAGSEIIPNPNGTAPGLICRQDGKVVVAMPGPANEFEPMLKALSGLLKELGGGQVLRSRTLKVAGIGESAAAEKVQDLMTGSNPTLAPYAKTGEVHFRLTAAAKTIVEAEALIDPLDAEVSSRLAPYIFGRDDESLAESVIEILKERGQTLGSVESCTGGGLGVDITAVPGSSVVFMGSIVSYANDVKVNVAGVDARTIHQRGAVSEDCALEMAKGAQKVLGADWGLSISGVAGPHGGTEAKPVGLVYIGCAGPDQVGVEEKMFVGTRDAIRAKARTAALFLLRRRLLEQA
jgi:nicotinamide-nucleotide amidase